MTTLLYHHPVFALHDTGPGHPERPARIESVLQALKATQFATAEWREAPEGDVDAVALVHPRTFIDFIRDAMPESGRRPLDPDTVVSAHSWEAVMRAVGAVTAGVDAVVAGEANNAFCAVRPPGHHAEPERAMGFCIFNSVAVGAAHARAKHGLDKVAIIDFDVHHGNGTQAVFWDEPKVLYVSSHQSPLYPGTGASSERGSGNIVNAPLPPNAGSNEIRQAWTSVMQPALEAFGPELILISAGFDAHAQDPLAQLEFQTEDYGWLTEQIMRLASEHSEGRVVSALEGGYDLDALAASVAAHVQAMMAG